MAAILDSWALRRSVAVQIYIRACRAEISVSGGYFLPLTNARKMTVAALPDISTRRRKRERRTYAFGASGKRINEAI